MQVPKFFDIIVHPRETAKAQISKVNMKEAQKTYLILGAIVGLFIALILLVIFSVAGSGSNQSGMDDVLAGLGLAIIIVVPVVMALATLVFAYITNGIQYLIAQVFGGKGKFETHFYVFSRTLWPLAVTGIIMFVLSAIPIIGWLIPFFWQLYVIYLSAILISVIHQVSMPKAFAIELLPLVLGFIIASIVAATIVAGIIASLGVGLIG